MATYELTEGEARLLVTVFDHLKPYGEQAKAKHTSVADEMNNADEKIRCTYQVLLRRELSYGLTNRENRIIIRRYGLSADGECHTLEEIAREFGVTRERIRQVEAKALKKIKRYMTELNDEETDRAICELYAKEMERLGDAVKAHKAGDSVSEEVYNHGWMVCSTAADKLRIQRALRKHRDQNE